jgi:N-methylhydantoinase A
MSRIAIDIGGTFTDVIGLDDEGGISYTKVLTTYPDPTTGFFEGIRKLGWSNAEYLGHGTTLATNALLTGGGARTALLTTRGFGDVLEIRRTHRQMLYDIYETIPPPLVPRDARFEISERVGFDGSVITPLKEEDVRRVAGEIRRRGFGAVAVCYLFSFVNDQHEQRTRQLLEEELPELRHNIAVSSEILALHREYERTSTTVISAMLMPQLREYFGELAAQVKASGAADNLLVMQNTGGLVSPRRAGEVPVLMLLSGPAGGTTATSFLGQLWGEKRLLAFDMGGTSTDVSAVVDGRPDVRLDFAIGGYDVSYPSIDIHTIGAGGGSQARVDPHGRLTVGPQSSRSTPGPACYGRGGEIPTVTDANVVLGYYDPDQLLGGELRIDPELAARAIETFVARPLGLDLREAARGIIAIVNSNMMHALRFVSIERGRDPREYALVPFGGAGPIHGAAIADELGMKRVLVPPVPGCTSAMGILAADLRHELVRAVHSKLAEVDTRTLVATVTQMTAEARALLRQEGIKPQSVRINAAADLRYLGQAYELTIPIPPARTDTLVRQLGERFHREHKRRYGHALPGERIEIVNLRVSGIGLTAKPALNGKAPTRSQLLDAHLRDRPVYVGRAETLTVPIFERSRLGPRTQLPSPCLVTQLDATTYIPPNATAVTDDFGTIVVHLG